ncbi:hypothetical protein D3C81_2118040 [compost metagenome]
MNDVLQLTGVARPTVLLQQPLRCLADKRHWQVKTLAVDPQEVLGQRLNVADPLTQRR